jgi:hypothetical protein
MVFEAALLALMACVAFIAFMVFEALMAANHVLDATCSCATARC